jgi:hypothetical protein
MISFRIKLAYIYCCLTKHLIELGYDTIVLSYLLYYTHQTVPYLLENLFLEVKFSRVKQKPPSKCISTLIIKLLESTVI